MLIISLTLWAYSSDTCWARKTSACAGLVLTPSTAFTAIQFLKTMQVIPTASWKRVFSRRRLSAAS